MSVFQQLRRCRGKLLEAPQVSDSQGPAVAPTWGQAQEERGIFHPAATPWARPPRPLTPACQPLLH